jgi:hypothetical protein
MCFHQCLSSKSTYFFEVLKIAAGNMEGLLLQKKLISRLLRKQQNISIHKESLCSAGFHRAAFSL